MEILSSALVLVAAISAGVSCMFVARYRGSINKHSRQHIKDIQQDMKYLSDMKKEEALEYRKQIQSLKGTVNKMKQGTTITDNDMKNSSLGEVILQMIPNKYRKVGSFLVPQIEEAVKKDPKENTENGHQPIWLFFGPTRPGTQKKWDSTNHTRLVNGTTTNLCRRDFQPGIVQYPYPHRCHFKGRFPLPGQLHYQPLRATPGESGPYVDAFCDSAIWPFFESGHHVTLGGWLRIHSD